MAWTIDDYNAGRMEIDSGRGWNGQDWVNFYNRYRPQQEQAPTAAPAAAASAQPTATTVPQQAQNAQTYSATPGAAPTANTSNQGTQDVVRNSYLQQATQGTQVDRNDPNFRQQADAFGAIQDRTRRQYQSEAAERLSAQGLGNSGAMENERRLSNENAANAQGAFESQLVARELQNRREEIQNALTNLRGMISADQAAELQRQLAELDAALKREGVSAQTGLGQQELALKDKLGMAGINVDLMRALLQNQQFGTSAGIQIGEIEANNYLRGLGL
jgi:hypothetical protein